MQRTLVVESGTASTERTGKEVGFDGEQARAQANMTGAADERSTDAATRGELAELRAEVRSGFATIHGRTDGLRDETNARFEGLEGRLDARFEGLRDEMNARFKGLRDEMDARFKGLRDEMDTRFEGLEGRLNARFEGLRDEMNARFEGLEGRLKLMLWFMGVGLTLYTGTTVSLMILLFRDRAV